MLLILVRAKEAVYWDTHGSKGLRYVFEAIKARVTDTRPAIKEGKEHGKTVIR